MKILVTGSNGLLGQNLIEHLPSDIHQVSGCDLSPDPIIEGYDYHRVDLTDKNATLDLIQNTAPNVIVHTAAMTAVDRCEEERELCWRTNVSATEHIIQASTKVGSKVVFISTDYVFDGSNGPYTEENRPNPLSYYGKSKLAAENLLRGSKIDWAIIRTIVLYGVGKNLTASFVTWLLKMLREEKNVNIVDDQWGNTTYVEDLCIAIERIIILERIGIFNVGSKDYATRFDFAKQISKVFELNESLINPISTEQLKQPAPRPLKSGLDVNHTEQSLFMSFHTMEESLEMYKQKENSLLV